MISRRDLAIGALAAFGAAAQSLPGLTLAQGSGQSRLVGWLRVGFADNVGPMAALFDELAALGWVEGRNLRVLHRHAEGRADRVSDMAADLVREGPAVILVAGTPMVRAVVAATNRIPIVAMSDDLVGIGLARSLARPGGNVTGVSILAVDLDIKRLELLSRAMPGARRIAILREAMNIAPDQDAIIAGAARQLGIEVRIFDAASSGDIPGAFARARDFGASAVNVLASSLLFGLRDQIVAQEAQFRLPVMTQWREFVDAGALISYGPNLRSMYRQMARITDRVLRGADPATMPIEQADRFELILNLRRARVLGIEVAQEIVDRADEVVE